MTRRSPRETAADRAGSDPEGSRQLLGACLRGDQAAWDELVERYGRLVYSVARRYRLADADCDDVFQGVFLTLHRSLATIREHDRLSSWLITTTHRECWRVGKRSSRAGTADHLDEMIADVGSPSPEQIETWEQQHLVRIALEELGGRCEALLRALFLAGHGADYRTVSEQLGIPIGSIGPTRTRCFRKLETILTRLGVEPPGGDRAAATGEA